MNIKALAIRALKTFIQASLGAISLGIVTTTSVPALRALLVGAVAAGVSAVMNLIINPQEAK